MKENYKIDGVSRWSLVYNLLNKQVVSGEVVGILINLVNADADDSDAIAALVTHYSLLLNNEYNIPIEMAQFEVEGLIGDILSNFEN